MSKKKQGSHQQPLSPKKYVVTRARTLQIYKCLINKDWKESGMASISVMRKHTNGHITAGYFLVDLMALGVKDTHFTFNEPEQEIMERINDQWPENFLEETSYILVHNIIYGAVAFAGDHETTPHGDFNVTQYILEEDTDDIEFMDISFGIDGKPVFIVTN